MSWSTAFLAALGRQETKRHRVRPVQVPTWVTTGGSDWVLTSDSSSMGLVIGPGGTSTGAKLSLPDWTSTLGGFTVQLFGDPREFRDHYWRGQIVVHEVSFAGWGDRWEPVEAGCIEGLSMSGDRVYTLTCSDLQSALRSRYVQQAQRWSLFSQWGIDSADPNATWKNESNAYTYVSIAYVAGNAVLYLDDKTKIAQPAADSALGGIVIVRPDLPDTRPASTGNNCSFRLLFTGSGSNYLSGVTTFGYGGLAGHAHDVNAVSTHYVQTVPGFVGNPVTILKDVLRGTGVASSPPTFSYSLGADLVDEADMDAWADLVAPTAGRSDKWLMMSDEVQTDGLGYLQGWARRAGIWLTMRQGKLTARAALAPWGDTHLLRSGPHRDGVIRGEYMVPGSERITDGGGGGANQVYECRVIGSISLQSPAYYTSVTHDVTSHPSDPVHLVDLSDTLYDSTDESYQRESVAYRIAPWVLMPPDAIEFQYTDPTARGLCPGDLVTFQCPHLDYRAGQLVDVPGMILSLDPDHWGDGPTRISAALAVPTSWRS